MREGWKEVKLGSLNVKFIDGDRGKNYPGQKDLHSDGYCLFLSAKNITSDGFKLGELIFINKEKDDILRKGKLTLNDIIITTRGTIGNVCIYDKSIPFKNVRINSGMLIIRNESNDIYNEFLFQFLKSDIFRNRTATFAFGAAVPQLPISTLINIKIIVPPLETQRKIANILSGYDDLIENNLKRIKILEEMAQQTYEEWFVRMRFPGCETAVFNENGLPEGWEKVKLGEACNLVMGQSPKSEDYNVDENGLPFHQGVKDYGYRFPLNKSWSISGNKKAIPNSILFSVRAPVGRLNVASEEIILGRGLAAINDKNGLNSFLYYQLRTIFFEDNLIGGGAIYASVTKNDVERIELIYAYKLADKFDNYASKIDKEILNLTNQNQRLREARDILLPRLMIGMIDVSGSLVQVESLEAKPTDVKVIPLEQPKKEASKEFKEAVLIACLTERFGSEKFPLGRKRYTKLSYLFHRYSDNKIQDYLRKAAGPYNPKTKYGGPEKIALNNKYIQNWKSDNKLTGFVSAEKIEDAKTYFFNYWQISDLDWLTAEFKFKSNDELELLATVDNSLVELSKKNLEFTSANVLDIIKSEKEWEVKLERTIFSDANVERAIGFLKGVLEYGK